MINKASKLLLTPSTNNTKWTNLFLMSYNSDKFGKNLTRKIMQIRSNKDIHHILNRYRGQFNSMNITALLKKVKRDTLSDSQIETKLLQQVRKQLQFLSDNINIASARPIANIICYIGNLQYNGLNDSFTNIDYPSLFKYTKPKEFVMILTSLLKLNIYQECIKIKISNLVKQNVDHVFQIGQLISIWRNVIKYKKCTKQVNEYLSKLIGLKEPNNNLKDYGYLMYCYTLAHQQISQPHKLQKMLQKYPEQILFSTRINIFEICILLDHLTKFRNLHPNLYFSQSFNYLLNEHFNRNIKAVSELRSLANGYYSLINHHKNPQPQIYYTVGTKFINMLSQIKQTSDYQSITSLFIQLRTSCPFNQLSDQLSNQDIQYSNYSLSPSVILESVIKFIFESNGQRSRIQEMQNKQFQKLCFGLQLYYNQHKQTPLKVQIKQKIIQSVLKRKFTKIQLSSLINIFSKLEIKSKNLCQYFYNQQQLFGSQPKKYKLVDKSNQKCIFNKGNSSRCLKCIQ